MSYPNHTSIVNIMCPFQHYASIVSIMYLLYIYFIHPFRSKTEGADKFWTSLEPYFSDITDSDLHNLHIGVKQEKGNTTEPLLPFSLSLYWTKASLRSLPLAVITVNNGPQKILLKKVRKQESYQDIGCQKMFGKVRLVSPLENNVL